MGWRSFSYKSFFSSLMRVPKPHWLPLSQRSKIFYDSGPVVLQNCCNSASPLNFQAWKSYSRGARKPYDLFGSRRPGDEDFKKTWAKEMDEDNTLWTGSEDESDEEKDRKSRLHKDIRKARQQAKEHADLVDADDSDELRSVWSGSDEEKTLWTGDEMDTDDDVPTEAYPNEKSDKYIDKIFEFDEMPKYRTISELLKAEQEPEELSPGKQARKIAVENALKKLKKGPDGRYTNAWEVMSDLDILIGAFENVVSGPEYEELRQGGPKQLNIQFFKDIQARMRDPNYKFSPELKLKPKSKFVSRKKFQKTESRKRKARKRLKRYRGFKEGHTRILVATDLVGRGIDIERVNIVINYDMPDSADTYLHRVGRAGRFGTKGLAITFVSCSSDVDVLNNVQSRFEIDIKQLPEQIDTSTYMPS